MASHVSRSFGMRVRDMRQTRGLTQESLAHRSGLSVEAVGRIERGAFSPTLETVEKLAHGLGVTLGELFAYLRQEPTGRVAELCQHLARLTPAQRQTAWDVLLSLFGTSTKSGAGER